ncbi:MAG: ABC transporter permease [Eisenbergiella massiliensis]
MFFDLISRNSRRSRKENGLFFASLLISVIAFYIILSLSQQDVIKFLMKMESDAISRLLRMIPLFYGMTLLILFFLIYFASKYQLERRRHEFGVYLMLGMRRSRLFILLLGEDIRNSAFVLAIGLPAAVLLSELISLVTARLTGLGIIGHRLSISLTAILWTAIGFALIKLAAFMILSGRIAGKEIGSLLTETPDGTKSSCPPPFMHWPSLPAPRCLQRLIPWLSAVFPGIMLPIWELPCCPAFWALSCSFSASALSWGCWQAAPAGKKSCIPSPSVSCRKT